MTATPLWCSAFASVPPVRVAHNNIICPQRGQAADLPKEEIDAFREEATAGDYNHLLQTAMRWFNID
jgi:hypothetical protein